MWSICIFLRANHLHGKAQEAVGGIFQLAETGFSELLGLLFCPIATLRTVEKMHIDHICLGPRPA